MTTRVHRETPAEYFKQLVDGALSRQRLKAGEMTAFYLVNLLCGFVRLDEGAPAPFDDRPLALLLGQALEREGSEQRARLRTIGDLSLFISGFFSDSLRRRIVDVDYYVAMGEYAYGSLSRTEAGAFAEIFGELAEKFCGFMDVLAEVSEQSALTSTTDLLRLYERWLRTGSRRSGQRLIEQGIVPNASIGSRFIQH
ncbi:MAG TPA: hypothetical protein VNI83_10675 [Vicinamibacterales bacterium]|nr:hypothetical protein [Vicinamibacterales bacterium]